MFWSFNKLPSRCWFFPVIDITFTISLDVSVIPANYRVLVQKCAYNSRYIIPRPWRTSVVYYLLIQSCSSLLTVVNIFFSIFGSSLLIFDFKASTRWQSRVISLLRCPGWFDFGFGHVCPSYLALGNRGNLRYDHHVCNEFKDIFHFTVALHCFDGCLTGLVNVMTNKLSPHAPIPDRIHLLGPIQPRWPHQHNQTPTFLSARSAPELEVIIGGRKCWLCSA